MTQESKKNSEVYKIIYDRFISEEWDKKYPPFDEARPTEDHDIITEQYSRLKDDRFFDFSAFIEVAFEWIGQEEE